MCVQMPAALFTTSHLITGKAPCQMCLQKYDLAQYKARTLPCSHVLCSACIIKQTNQVGGSGIASWSIYISSAPAFV